MQINKTFIFILLFIALLTSCKTLQEIKHEKKELYKHIRIIDLSTHYKITPKDVVTDFSLKIKLIKSYDWRQKVISRSFSIPPLKIITVNGYDFAIFEPKYITKQKEIVINYKVEVSIYDLDYFERIISERLIDDTDKTPLSQEELKPYLKNEPLIEIDHPDLVEVAKQFNQYEGKELIRKIFDYVRSNITYEHQKNENGALYALQNKKGDCTEFASLFIALCRLNNIPARYTIGISIVEKGNAYHAWAELYLENVGWFIVDPTATTDQYFNKKYRDVLNLYIITGYNEKDTRYRYTFNNNNKVDVDFSFEAEWLFK